MNKFTRRLFNILKQLAEYQVKRYSLPLPLALIAMASMTFLFTAQAQNPEPISFTLTPTSNSIAICMPSATARVTVSSRDDLRGVDTLDLKAKGLLPDTTFTVFLTELPEFPFGAAQFIGEFTTNAGGRGSLRVDTVITDAFSSTVVGSGRVRKELNHMVIWFADPAADDTCFAPIIGPTTPFDADGEAGSTVLSSRTFLPGAPLP
jgi:hypothetical protein